MTAYDGWFSLPEEFSNSDSKREIDTFTIIYWKNDFPWKENVSYTCPGISLSPFT